MDLRRLLPAALPWPLLLDADPHAPHVQTYLHRSMWFGLYDQETLVGVAALLRRDARAIELMNIAVMPSRRRQGIGMLFMRHLVVEALGMGARRIEVGTGNSSFAELAFYQRVGFRLEAIEQDHFVREYPEPIVENGIQCRDRLLLALRLDEAPVSLTRTPSRNGLLSEREVSARAGVLGAGHG